MRHQRIKYVTEEDKTKLLAVVTDQRNRTLLRLLLATGVRVSELVGFNVGDVRGRTILVIRGKGNKLRELPIADEIQTMLAAYIADKSYHGESIDDTAPLFLNCWHQRIQPRGVHWNFVQWCKRAGLERMYSPHACRHYVGITLLRKTQNLRIVQEYLGHSRVTTTQIYTQLTTNDLKPAAELLAA